MDQKALAGLLDILREKGVSLAEFDGDGNPTRLMLNDQPQVPVEYDTVEPDGSEVVYNTAEDEGLEPRRHVNPLLRHPALARSLGE